MMTSASIKSIVPFLVFTNLMAKIIEIIENRAAKPIVYIGKKYETNRTRYKATADNIKNVIGIFI